MTKSISVKEALSKAQRMITIPSMLLMFGVITLFYLLGENEIIPKGFMLIGFLSAIILGWIVWSIQVPKWKLWAFARVNNIEELKKQAVESKIIWRDKHIFTKTEIWSLKDKEKLNQLLSK